MKGGPDDPDDPDDPTGANGHCAVPMDPVAMLEKLHENLERADTEKAELKGKIERLQRGFEDARTDNSKLKVRPWRQQKVLRVCSVGPSRCQAP
eukprot:974308-Pyramimonas_sp.AAC.1